ncbi:hypothetical protein GY45DRAFT_905755 [Cubamyces sp. BRFM 1775]|nr:hypothetical protein GY45DRAFT_905755 [Cubamyces sp. BRFM 1775]
MQSKFAQEIGISLPPTVRIDRPGLASGSVQDTGTQVSPGSPPPGTCFKVKGPGRKGSVATPLARTKGAVRDCLSSRQYIRADMKERSPRTRGRARPPGGWKFRDMDGVSPRRTATVGREPRGHDSLRARIFGYSRGSCGGRKAASGSNPHCSIPASIVTHVSMVPAGAVGSVLARGVCTRPGSIAASVVHRSSSWMFTAKVVTP